MTHGPVDEDRTTLAAFLKSRRVAWNPAVATSYANFVAMRPEHRNMIRWEVHQRCAWGRKSAQLSSR